MIIKTPWSDEAVAALNLYQSDSRFHSYTCGNPDHEERAPDLVATRGGFACPSQDCFYLQQWAYLESLAIIDGLGGLSI